MFSALRVCVDPVAGGGDVGAGCAAAVVPPAPAEECSGLRWSRRFLGLEAEYDEIVRVSRRRRFS